MVLLVISATSSDSGAGMQMDIKTADALRVYCASVVTSVTAQNTKGVASVFNLPVREVSAQMDSVISDFRIDAVKVGLIGDAKNFAIISKKLRGKKIVLDPVLESQSDRKKFVSKKHVVAMREFMQDVFLVTANAEECLALCGVRVTDVSSASKAAFGLMKLGAKNALVKGIRSARKKTVSDYLFSSKRALEFEKKLVKTGTHGGGCLLSTAIAANLSRGMGVEAAVWDAEFFAHKAIASAKRIGKGIEIVNPCL